MEAANEVPGPGARCEESTDATLAGSDPTRWAQGAHKGPRDGTARHSPRTAGRDPQGSSQEPSPGQWSSQPQGQDPWQPLGTIHMVT